MKAATGKWDKIYDNATVHPDPGFRKALARAILDEDPGTAITMRVANEELSPEQVFQWVISSWKKASKSVFKRDEPLSEPQFEALLGCLTPEKIGGRVLDELLDLLRAA